MSKTAKLVYFFVAILTMALLAAASLAMAQNRAALSVTLFVIAFALIAASFIVKARILARSGESTPRRKREA